MKHLHKEEMLSRVYANYNSYIDPTVIKILEPEQIIYSLDNLFDDPRFENEEYLSIYALGGGSVTIRINGTLNTGEYLAYKIEDGDWINVTSNTSVGLNAGQIIRFKGNRTSYCPSGSASTFYCNFYFVVFGNINSLTEDPIFGGFSTSPYNNRQFAYLFSSNYYLMSVKYLKIPNEVRTYSLASMFLSCSNLVDTPKEEIYLNGTYAASGMFSDCSSLKNADKLTINTYGAASACYQMFKSCIKLTTLPTINELNSVQNATSTYASMFEGCSSLTTVPEDYIPGLISGQYVYYRMFYNCTKLSSIPKLHGVLQNSACYQMFYNCLGLEFIPYDYFSDTRLYVDPASTVNSCEYMFCNCKNLTQGPAYLPITCVTDMCSYAHIFQNCEKLEQLPIIYTIRTKNESNGSTIFSGCTELKYITSLALYNTDQIYYTGKDSVIEIWLGAKGTDIPISISSQQYSNIHTLVNTTLSSGNLSNCNIINDIEFVAPPVKTNVTFSTDAKQLWDFCVENAGAWLYNSTDDCAGYVTDEGSTASYYVHDIWIGNQCIRVARLRDYLDSYLYYVSVGYNTDQTAAREILDSWLTKNIYIFDKEDYDSCFGEAD